MEFVLIESLKLIDVSRDDGQRYAKEGYEDEAAFKFIVISTVG